MREIVEVWQQTCAAVANDRIPPTLNGYVHVPFCEHRCSYCTYQTHPGRQPDERERWLQHLEAELDFFGPVFAGTELTNFSIGGGTPTSLGEAQLERLLARMDAHFSVGSTGVKTFESNPLSYTEQKARCFARHGFNRASIGVQTMTETALGKANRSYQTGPMVRDALRSALDLGFWVNVDLITGLPGDTPEAFFAGVDELLVLRPHELTFAPLFHDSPPAVLREAGRWGLEPAALLSRLSTLARDAGYDLVPAPFEPKIWRNREAHEPGDVSWSPDQSPHYSFSNSEPVSLFGLGPSARCHAFGHLIYQYEPTLSEQPFDPDQPVARGRRIDLDEEMRRYAMFNLYEEPALSAKDFRRLFHTPLLAALGDELRTMQQLDLVTVDDHSWTLRPSKTLDRFAACMFLLPVGAANEVMSQHQREVRLPRTPPVEPEPAAVVRLEVSGHGDRLEVVLCRHHPQQACCWHGGGFAFFIPNPESSAMVLGAAQQRLEHAFSRILEQAAKPPPDTLHELARRVVAAGRADLRVVRVESMGGDDPE